MNNIQTNQAWLDAIAQPEQQWSLLHMSFLVAEWLQPEIDMEAGRQTMQELRSTAYQRYHQLESVTARLEAINDYLFVELGFAANHQDYFNPDNSLINRVIATRKGIPITLALIYMDLLGALNVRCNGINFPGHFLVGVWDSQHYRVIDAFRDGVVLDKSDVKKMLANSQVEVHDDEELASFLQPSGERQIIIRLLRNLKNLYLEQQDAEKSLAVIEMILSLAPASSDEIRDRGMVYHYLEYADGALHDLSTYLTMEPESSDRTIIEALIDSLKEKSGPLH